MIEQRRRPVRLLLAAGVVKADKEQIRRATRRWQDLYDTLGVDPRMLLQTGRGSGRDDGPGPEAA